MKVEVVRKELWEGNSAALPVYHSDKHDPVVFASGEFGCTRFTRSTVIPTVLTVEFLHRPVDYDTLASELKRHIDRRIDQLARHVDANTQPFDGENTIKIVHFVDSEFNIRTDKDGWLVTHRAAFVAEANP